MPNNSADNLKPAGETSNYSLSAAWNWFLSQPVVRALFPENGTTPQASDTLSQQQFLAACEQRKNQKKEYLSDLILKRLLATVIPLIEESIKTIDPEKLVKDGKLTLEHLADQVLVLPECIKVREVRYKNRCLQLEVLVGGEWLILSANVTDAVASHFKNRFGQLLPSSIQASDLLTQSLHNAVSNFKWFPTDDKQQLSVAFDFSVETRLSERSDRLNQLCHLPMGTPLSGKDLKPITHTLHFSKSPHLLANSEKPSVVNGVVIWPEQPYIASFINANTEWLQVATTHLLSQQARSSTIVEEKVGYALTEIVVTESGIAVTLSPQCEPLEPAECLPPEVQSHYIRRSYPVKAVALSNQNSPQELLKVLKPLAAEKSSFLSTFFGFEKSVVTVGSPTVTNNFEEDRRHPGSVHG